MAFAWGSEKPSRWRRWVNFRVSKWWSRWGVGVVLKVRGCWERVWDVDLVGGGLVEEGR